MIVMIMASTMQEVLRPLFIACFIMGLGIYPIKQLKSKIRWIAHLGLLYSLIVWFVYGYILYYIVTIFTLKELLGSYIIKIVVLLNSFTSIMSVITSLYYRKRFEICIEKLATVDDTLEELGTPKMYREMYMWSIGILFGWIIFTFVINVYDIIWWWNTEKLATWRLLVAYIINHPFHINAFMDLLFIFFLRHLYLELCRIARELNFIFEMQLGLGAVSILLFLTGMCYLFITTALIQTNKAQIELNILFGVSVWIFILFLRFYAVNYICENVKFKANKIRKIIHQLTNSLHYSAVWKEIQQITLHTIQNPLEFTGMGLFNFGNECLQKFCITVVTFVIIMIQLQMPSDIRD